MWLRMLPVFTCLTIAAAQAADAPQPRPETTNVLGNSQAVYYWNATSVGDTAQLVTLFCRYCTGADSEGSGLPLISVLRDTLGEGQAETTRITAVWLLTYSPASVPQRMLSAVPFFYWRVGEGSKSLNEKPFFDLTSPERPVFSEAARDLLQWTTLDPMTTPVRATSRAYRSNELDHERLHLEEAISYLRSAPAAEDGPGLTREQLDIVIARLELRKRLLGGFATEKQAERLGERSGYEQERIQARNWEILRQCADKTGLWFEPIDLAGSDNHYVILWYPIDAKAPVPGTAGGPIWKLLNISDPWTDARLRSWSGRVYDRAVDANGVLLPFGAESERHLRVVPLGVYSLAYPKAPLLLVDFRDRLHVRRHEMAQRSINEITAGVIGISHFTNWYYYVGADLYDFVVSRHGAAVDEAARLDCYSQFRVALALDRQLNPELRSDMQRRIDSLAINPLESDPKQELRLAQARYAKLQQQGDSDQLRSLLDKDRREELASFGETRGAEARYMMVRMLTLGLYTHRVKASEENLSTLDRDRRVAHDLTLLDGLARAGTQPEVVYSADRIQDAVRELASLMPSIGSRTVRAHATQTLEQLKALSRDEQVQADCTEALASLNDTTLSRPGRPRGLAAATRTAIDPADPLQ